jgi:hypothetical protein
MGGRLLEAGAAGRGEERCCFLAAEDAEGRGNEGWGHSDRLGVRLGVGRVMWAMALSGQPQLVLEPGLSVEFGGVIRDRVWVV